MNNSESFEDTIPFPGYVITVVHYKAFGEDREFRVPDSTYGIGETRVGTCFEALEALFRQLNAVDGTELISEAWFRKANPHLRSMCVGDEVTFKGFGFRKTFVCEGMGWKEVAE